MSASAEMSTRARLSDPRPAYCAACFRGAEAGVKFVDFDGAASDRGQVVEMRDGMVWHRESIDEIHLCESCVRDAMEVLAIKPSVSVNQLRTIRGLERQLAAVQSYTRDLERTLANRPVSLNGAR